MLSNACFEYCRFAIKCVPLVLRTHKEYGILLWCDSLLIVKTLNERNERSVENTLVSTHNTDKRGFVVVAT